MSFARSVLQSKQIAARAVARSSPAASTTTATTSRTQTSKFWTTAPVEQEETQIKEAVKMTTQKEIVKAIAETHDLSLAESKRILSTVFDTIVDVSVYAELQPYRIAYLPVYYVVSIVFNCKAC
jgi:HSP90 family molecular chaperone